MNGWIPLAAAAACAVSCALGCVSSAPSVSAAAPSAEGDALFQMPAQAKDARSPDEVRANRPAELAEAALGLVSAERPGGPDYIAATKLALLAAAQADPVAERDLVVSCHRFAARSALRAGVVDLYVDTIDAWDRVANQVERTSGELSVHAAIRDRIRGEARDLPLSDSLLGRLLSQPQSTGAAR